MALIAAGDRAGAMDPELCAVLERMRAKVCSDPSPLSAEEVAAAKAAAWAERAACLGIPPRLREASFKTARPTCALESARRFLMTEAPQGRCLMLFGPTGVGKSYAAAAALQAWDRPSGQFLYWPDLCARLLCPESRREAMKAATAPELVVLDDLGAEYLKDGGLLAACLDSIVWRRHAYLTPTIVTTNLTPEQLRLRVSDRIADRLSSEWASSYSINHGSLRQSTTLRPLTAQLIKATTKKRALEKTFDKTRPESV